MDNDILSHVFSVWGMIIFVVFCSMMGGAIAVIAKNWRKTREAELEATIKAEMIKQGRSVEDIERVLKATGKGTPPD